MALITLAMLRPAHAARSADDGGEVTGIGRLQGAPEADLVNLEQLKHSST
jgi:hypothetical protein